MQGCRLPSGGGTIRPGAMPPPPPLVGQPDVLGDGARACSGHRVHDVYCGLRGFTKDLFDRLDLRCTGMEFATEMVIKSSLQNARIAEVPITLHPDGRKAHAPHLKTFRDGWRTLRFFLMCSPRWLFLYPGICPVGAWPRRLRAGVAGRRIGGVRLDAHTLLFSSLAILLGQQA